MKKILFAIIVIISMVSCKKVDTENTETSSPTIQKTTENKPAADAKKASIKIDGMTCAIGCAKTIETKLSELEGVQKAVVDFDSKMATIEYDGTLQNLETLSKTIENVADGKTYKVLDKKNI